MSPGRDSVQHRTAARFLALAVASLLANVATSEELQSGVTYSGGTRVESAELGVAFTVPQGWSGGLPPGAEAFVMRPDGNPNVNVLAMAEPGSAADLETTLANRIDLGDGIALLPAGQLAREGRRFVARYQVQGAATPLSAYAMAWAGDHGVSIAFLAVAGADALAPLEAVVQALADGATLAAPSGAAAAGGSTNAGGSAGDRWDVYLKGKYIVRYYTSSGYTDEQHLWLCSDGTFARQGAGGGFGGGASGAFQSDSTGRWQATGAGASGVLTLHYGDGSVARHDLEWNYEKNQLFVDGKRWLHDQNQRCR